MSGQEHDKQGPAPDSRKRATRIICSALFLPAAMAAHGGASDRPDPEEWLREAGAAYGRVTSYTAIFHKQQRVAGKLLAEEAILLKFRKPSSLYMKWMAGWNENRIRAHRGGVLRFITRNLDPRDPGLMAGNRRPVTSTGIGYLLDTVALKMHKAIKVGELSFSQSEKKCVRQEHAGPGSGFPKGESKGLRRLPVCHQPGCQEQDHGKDQGL